MVVWQLPCQSRSLPGSSCDKAPTPQGAGAFVFLAAAQAAPPAGPRSGDLAARVVLRNLWMAGDPVEVPHQRRGNAVDQVFRNMVERARAQPTDQHVDLEVRHRQPPVGKVFTARGLQ